MRVAFVLSVSVCAVVLAGCAGSHNATLLPGLTDAKSLRIKAIVSSDFKELTGEESPSSVLVFATGRREVNTVDGPQTVAPGRRGVYFVVFHGHFTCVTCSVWPGSRPDPPGDITVVLDRETLRQLDECLCGHVNTNKLGAGAALQLGKA